MVNLNAIFESIHFAKYPSLELISKDAHFLDHVTFIFDDQQHLIGPLSYRHAFHT